MKGHAKAVSIIEFLFVFLHFCIYGDLAYWWQSRQSSSVGFTERSAWLLFIFIMCLGKQGRRSRSHPSERFWCCCQPDSSVFLLWGHRSHNLARVFLSTIVHHLQTASDKKEQINCRAILWWIFASYRDVHDYLSQLSSVEISTSIWTLLMNAMPWRCVIFWTLGIWSNILNALDIKVPMQ